MSSQAGNAPAAGPSAAQQVMQSEAQERERRVLQALIEAAAVTDPTITQRVTIAAVWQYMRLPDESFGWSGRKDEQGNRPRMPTEAKALCILTTLSLGLMPGVGHVLWLGNKCYVTADARRFLANASPDWVKVGTPRLRPFSDGEKEMFAVEAGDMHCVLEQPVRLKGVELTAIGYGLIGLDELEWRDRNQNRKAGMQTKKDAVMHLITRAERDMLNRTFPLRGVSDAPDDWRQEGALDVTPTPSVALEAPAAPPATAIMAAEESLAAAKARSDATQRIADLAARVVAAGGKPSELVGVPLVGQWFNTTPVDEMHDAGDALEAWLAEHELPDPTPPAGAPAPQPTNAAATEAAPAKKRGRPRKDATAAAPAPAAHAALEADEALRVKPAGPFTKEELERRIADERRPEAADLDEPGDPEGDEPSFERELTDETLAMAEAGRNDELGADLSEEGDAFEPAAPFEPTRSGETYAPVPMPDAPAAPSGPITAARDRAEAAERLRLAIADATKRGAAPMQVLGINPHNRLADPKASALELGEMAHLLETWTPERRSAVEKNNAAREAIKGPPQPAAPAPGAKPFERVPAHDLLARALTMPDNAPPLQARLEELSAGTLGKSDHLYLPKAIREAKTGNYRGLDELLAAARKAR